MKLPAWLLEEQNVPIKKGKEHFLIRNRSSLTSILKQFHAKTEIPFSHYFHPTTWFLLLIILLLGISLTKQVLYLWIFSLTLLSIISVLPYRSMIRILKKTLLLCVFPFIVYLPSLFWQNGNFLFIVRIPLVSLLFSFYTELTSLTDLLTALKKLKLPDIILLQFDITLKYIYVFGDFLMNVLKAVEARALGRHLSFAIGNNIWGIIYLKALTYSKDLQKAMEARGFNGHYYNSDIPFTYKDYLILLVTILVLLLLIF